MTEEQTTPVEETSGEAVAIRIDGVVYPLGGGIRFQEGVAIEKVTGLTIAEWETAVESGSLQSLGALVWVLMKRQEPTLAWRDVDFDLDSLAWLDADGNEVTGEAEQPVPTVDGDEAEED